VTRLRRELSTGKCKVKWQRWYQERKITPISERQKKNGVINAMQYYEDYTDHKHKRADV
jgi:hypothetical protein